MTWSAAWRSTIPVRAQSTRKGEAPFNSFTKRRARAEGRPRNARLRSNHWTGNPSYHWFPQIGLLKMGIPGWKHRVIAVIVIAAAASTIGCSSADAPERATRIPQSPAPPTSDLGATVDALVQQRLSDAKTIRPRTPVTIGPTIDPSDEPSATATATATASPEDPTPVGNTDATATPEPTPSPETTPSPEPTPTNGPRPPRPLLRR